MYMHACVSVADTFKLLDLDSMWCQKASGSLKIICLEGRWIITSMDTWLLHPRALSIQGSEIRTGREAAAWKRALIPPLSFPLPPKIAWLSGIVQSSSVNTSPKRFASHLPKRVCVPDVFFEFSLLVVLQTLPVDCCWCPLVLAHSLAAHWVPQSFITNYPWENGQASVFSFSLLMQIFFLSCGSSYKQWSLCSVSWVHPILLTFPFPISKVPGCRFYQGEAMCTEWLFIYFPHTPDGWQSSVALPLFQVQNRDLHRSSEHSVEDVSNPKCWVAPRTPCTITS